MKNVTNQDRIINAAADYASIEPEDMRALDITLDGTEYALTFHTDYMSYTMYIDFGGAVLGFLSEPVPMESENVALALDSARCA